MTTEHFDVIIVGAGLSGIGAACHLQDKCPGKSYVILENRQSMGGTWDLFRYPGIRSDSDMHTLGYSFKPWRASKAIADGPSILSYIKETAAENDIDRHVRYGHLVSKANWSSEDASWTVEARCGDDPVTVRGNVLLMCAGYYSYKAGYLPVFEGRERFRGDIVHPQEWPEDLDYGGKRIVIIGSGATAVTLLPELAEEAGHVVMLQRSPTYMISWPDTDPVANVLRRLLPERTAYAITRWKNIQIQRWIYRYSRRSPDKARKLLINWVRKELPPDYDVEKHFTPDYDPWDQRLCLVPNSDLFRAVSSGKASIVTDEVATITENGIRLKSGEHLDAEIIVTATGLNLVVLGEVELVVDDEPVDYPNTFSYKGIMISGVPNMVSTFGYINASWTLRADLVAEYVCRLVNHMDQTGARQCTPRLRDSDRDMKPQPWVTGFSSGYIQRVMEELPKQGDREPWLNPQNYLGDKPRFLDAPLDDGVLEHR
ncbi:MAG: NAD(P)-binding protein [Burkholderiales bacterium]|nr:NAD(P)-binding protein [Burkholderiales bacterium]